MSSRKRSTLNRRDFLKGGTLAGAAFLATLVSRNNPSTLAAGEDVFSTFLPLIMQGTGGGGASAPLEVIALNRMAFGPRPGDIEAFRALGNSDEERLTAYVQQQLDPDSIDDSEFETRYAAAGFQTLHKSLEELFTDHIVNNPYDENDEAFWDWYSLPIYELVDATILRAVYSRKQLSEVLADFWFNHFNVYLWQDQGGPLAVSYDRDALRANMFGNFRQMLEAVATHPTMLYYLNQNNSSDAGPNENYARELLELHTLGAENYLGVQDPTTVEKDENGIAIGYVDNDVYEVARCLTGWRVDDDTVDGGNTGRFLYYKPWHDRFNKFVLGRYIPADQPDMKDGHDVLDLLAHHPGTARFIARKLCRRFIADDPPDSIVQAAADTFLAYSDDPEQLKRVYETILLSPEFAHAWGQKIKRPLEATYAMLRALEADFTRVPEALPWVIYLMGQGLFSRRTPDGYPDTIPAWANTMSILYRWNLALALTENWLNEENGPAIHVDVRAQTPANLRTPAGLADFWIARLLGRPLPDASRQAVVDFIARGEYGPDDELPEEDFDYWLNGMVQVVLMAPEFSLR